MAGTLDALIEIEEILEDIAEANDEPRVTYNERRKAVLAPLRELATVIKEAWGVPEMKRKEDTTSYEFIGSAEQTIKQNLNIIDEE